MAQVNPGTAGALVKTIDKKLAEGATHLHLMISSPGGSVFHGLSIYNFLKGCGANITTYNFGSVDSIGVAIFCAGAQRYSVPNARFHIHGVKLGFQGNAQFDEKGLEEHIKLLKADYTNIARVIAANTGKTEKKVVSDMNKQVSLMPEKALEYGLVHEVKPELIPAGEGMAAIYEDGSVYEYSATPQQEKLRIESGSEVSTGQPKEPSEPPKPTESGGLQSFTGPPAMSFTAGPQNYTSVGSD